MVALIELDEGPRLLSSIIGIPPEAVACDMPVRVVTCKVSPRPLPPRALASGGGGRLSFRH